MDAACAFSLPPGLEAMAAASGLKEDLSASQAVVASLEKQVEQRSQEVAAASHEVTRSCTQISRLEADLSEAMAAVAEAEGKIAEGGKALARKEGEMAELEGTMAELRRRWTETQEAREAEAKERWLRAGAGVVAELRGRLRGQPGNEKSDGLASGSAGSAAPAQRAGAIASHEKKGWLRSRSSSLETERGREGGERVATRADLKGAAAALTGEAAE